MSGDEVRANPRRHADEAIEAIDDVLAALDVGSQTAADRSYEPAGTDRTDLCWRCLDQVELSDAGLCAPCTTILASDDAPEAPVESGCPICGNPECIGAMEGSVQSWIARLLNIGGGGGMRVDMFRLAPAAVPHPASTEVLAPRGSIRFFPAYDYTFMSYEVPPPFRYQPDEVPGLLGLDLTDGDLPEFAPVGLLLPDDEVVLQTARRIHEEITGTAMLQDPVIDDLTGLVLPRAQRRRVRLDGGTLDIGMWSATPPWESPNDFAMFREEFEGVVQIGGVPTGDGRVQFIDDPPSRAGDVIRRLAENRLASPPDPAWRLISEGAFRAQFEAGPVVVPISLPAGTSYEDVLERLSAAPNIFRPAPLPVEFTRIDHPGEPCTFVNDQCTRCGRLGLGLTRWDDTFDQRWDDEPVDHAEDDDDA